MPQSTNPTGEHYIFFTNPSRKPRYNLRRKSLALISIRTHRTER